MYHLQVSHRRRRKRSGQSWAEVPEQVEQPDSAADVSLKLTVRDALSRPTEKQHAILVLRHFDDLSECETAALQDDLRQT